MRLLQHLFTRSAHAVYPPDSLQRIADAIAAGEARHRGEICFAVESALPVMGVLRGLDARTRATQVFSHLQVWNTHANNGVLLYLLLADHRIEIVADRGLDGLVSTEQWRGVCQLMEERLKAGDAEDAAVTGVAATSALLAEHFPRVDGYVDTDELPNLPRILR